ncbi:MAG: HypC/HybG/HupF family hydrogenase formation chaperone [Polyangiaceae bacterium]
MCLSVPGRVTEIFREGELLMGRVAFGEVVKAVCLEYVPDVVPGDYVLVHVGFALARIDEQEAQRVFELLLEFGQASEVAGGEGAG